ncbi:MAG: hypothetical protein EHM91_09300 [Planctomycetota bacterium]|nr:MAG: hypothetical protein EHM91_09300 [Planctomycetota bacterium]
MAKESKDSGSMVVIALSALLALGAAGGVWYCYGETAKAEALLVRSKGEYKKMAEQKRAVEEYKRVNKGKKEATVETNEDMMVFLDKKSREAQIPPTSITFSKNAPSQLATWVETSYTATLQGNKDAPVKKNPIVDFLRRVEAERRATRVRSLQLVFNGDDLKSAMITFSQFTPKQ